jgi:hypothetical protein
MDQYLLRTRLEVLRGTLDPENPLSALRGNSLVWRDIFNLVDNDWYAKHIEWTEQAYSIRLKVLFPPPRGININMMPINICDYPLKIPEECQGYRTMIFWCRRHIIEDAHSSTKVAYLTITESEVPVGEAQRRPGLHVERPGAIVSGKGGHIVHPGKSGYRQLMWGMGVWTRDGIPTDGIMMASNLANTSVVWPAIITSPEEVSDAHGGIEHMRKLLGEGRGLPASELCWITDRTPHESVPVIAPADKPDAVTVYRQFFRLVLGPISVWYSRHNTPNPFGVLPDAPISDEDKFASFD